jgi:peptide/nickel transport system permease protein
MLAYTLRRLLLGLLNLLLITFVVYGLIRAMPGDPTVVDPTNPEYIPSARERAERLRAWDLDRHWTAGYALWLGKVVRGDLGVSLYRHEPVLDAIVEAMGPTLLLSGTSLVLAFLLSVPIGVHAARRSGRADERVLSGVLYLLYSAPSYVVAILLLLVFSVKLDWLPLSRMVGPDYESLSLGGKLFDRARHLVLPVLCYTYGSLAFTARFVRSSLREALAQDYILAARARGLPERAVIWRHAFRNALVPFVTLLGLSLAGLLGGSVILESIFSWPGMGLLFYESINARDYTLIMGLTLMFGTLIVLGTLLADLLYAAVDPRISYS